jgi:hypothetical protein
MRNRKYFKRQKWLEITLLIENMSLGEYKEETVDMVINMLVPVVQG